MELHYLEGEVVFAGYKGANFNILVGAAIPFSVITADADIEEMQVVPLLIELMDNYRAVHAPGN
jgi:hypothetical protein